MDSTDYRFKSEFFKGHKDVKYGLPFINDSIDYKRIEQSITLNLSQVDTLGDVLYNSCSRWKYAETNTAFCYRPHHAILFYESTGNVFEYIEICLECHRTKYSSTQVTKFEQCDVAFNELKNYFRALQFKTIFD